MKNILLDIPWRRLMSVGKPFWASEDGKTGFKYLITILLLLTAKTYLAVFVVRTAGNFMTAIEQKSLGNFYLYLAFSVVAICFTVPIEVYYNLTKTRLSLLWRNWLSDSFIHRYFVQRHGMSIENASEIDNPEQRITQDVDSFCNSSVRLSITILDAAVSVCTFMFVLWNLSTTLVCTVIIYSTVGLLVVSHIGRALIELSNRQIAIEADLRATIKDARVELDKASSRKSDRSLTKAVNESKLRLTSVMDTLTNIMLVHKNIQLFTGTYNHIMPLIPAVIMTPAYMSGDIEFGAITQAVLAFTAVFNGATVLIGHFGDISHFAAIVNRLGSLEEGMKNRKDVSFQTENALLVNNVYSNERDCAHASKIVS